MYTIDSRDRVIELPDLPPSSGGAPCPIVLGDEHSSVMAYYVQDNDGGWDGVPRSVSPTTSDEPIALVHFRRCRASYAGPPNDESFAGHPLAERGLRPYGAFEVLESSWIREMIRRNEVHSQHRPETFAAYRHIVLTFHDSITEFIAESYTVHQARGSVLSMLPRMAELMS